jgi:excisionase family DNA binding protein
MVPLLYSIAEAARLLGVGRTKAYDLIDRGDLETVYIDARRLVIAASLNALIERLPKGGAVEG